KRSPFRGGRQQSQIGFSKSKSGSSPSSTRVDEFFPDDAAQRGLQRFVRTANVLSQSVVDQALIVAAASPIHLPPEPIQNVIVDPDGNSRLALGHGHHRSASGAAEVIFTFHASPRIVRSRAELPAGRK